MSVGERQTGMFRQTGTLRRFLSDRDGQTFGRQTETPARTEPCRLASFMGWYVRAGSDGGALSASKHILY